MNNVLNDMLEEQNEFSRHYVTAELILSPSDL
jgi:hypothetical protein